MQTLSYMFINNVYRKKLNVMLQKNAFLASGRKMNPVFLPKH